MSGKADYLVCVNSEKYSEIAFRFTCKMAKANDASVIILHIIEPSNYNSFGAIADKMLVESHEQAEKILESLSKTAYDEFNITAQLVTKEGLIEDEIVAFIESHESVEMLFIGASHDSALKGKVLPSLVDQSGKKLNIPITIVPGNLYLDKEDD